MAMLKQWRSHDLMTTQDPIDQDLIDAYRSDAAPAGFAARLTRAAVAQAQARSNPLKWALPAIASIALVVAVVWNYPNDATRQQLPRMEVSFSALPSALPTLSSSKTLAVPSIAALATIPSIPTLDLTMPEYGRIKSQANQLRTPKLPN